MHRAACSGLLRLLPPFRAAIRIVVGVQWGGEFFVMSFFRIAMIDFRHSESFGLRGRRGVGRQSRQRSTFFIRNNTLSNWCISLALERVQIGRTISPTQSRQISTDPLERKEPEPSTGIANSKYGDEGVFVPVCPLKRTISENLCCAEFRRCNNRERRNDWRFASFLARR